MNQSQDNAFIKLNTSNLTRALPLKRIEFQHDQIHQQNTRSKNQKERELRLISISKSVSPRAEKSTQSISKTCSIRNWKRNKDKINAPHFHLQKNTMDKLHYVLL